MIHHHFDFASIISGAAVYGTLSYAANTIPALSNPWARWLVGILQYVLANKAKGDEAMNGITAPPRK